MPADDAGRIQAMNSKSFRKTFILSFVLFASVIFGATFVAWRQNGYPTMGIDDANIFFSYAENFAAGHGFVYGHNSEPVEGFTSMLWTLLCALCFAIRANETGVFVLSMILLVVAQWICWNLLWRILEEKGVVSHLPLWLYAMAILSSSGYVMWMSITLMDVALWGFFLAWFAWVFHESCQDNGMPVHSRIFVRSIPFALAPLVRPEFMAIVPSLLGMLFLRNLILKRPVWHLLVWGGVYLAFLGTLTAFRLWYFGYPFPNTFYAKVSPSLAYNLNSGIQYALQFFTSSVFGMLFCAMLAGRFAEYGVATLSARARKSVPSGPADMLLVWTALLCILPILTGGDHFAYSRFYQPLYPLLCLGLVEAIPSKTWRFAKQERLQAFVLGSLLTLLPFGWHYSISWLHSHWGRLPATHEFEIAGRDMRLGRTYNELFANAHQLPSVGVITAGGIARAYDGPLIDLMGLNNATIAHFPGLREGMKNHAAFEVEVFHSLGVDVLAVDNDISFANKVLKNLFEKSEFIKQWRCGQLDNEVNGKSAILWIHQPFLDALLLTGHYTFRDLKQWDGTGWVSL